MKTKNFAFVFFSVFIITMILQSGIVSCYEVQKIEVSVDERGEALVLNLFSIDSRNVSEFFLPVFSPRRIRVYDEQGVIDYIYLDGDFIVYPRLEQESYSFTVEYLSDYFTSKNGSNWTFSFDYYKARDFDFSILTVALPSNAKIYSISENAVIYSEEGLIKVEFDIPNDVISKTFEIGYGFESEPIEPEPFPFYLISIPVLIVLIFVVIFLFWGRLKTKKKFSKEQGDLVHTLAENEKTVVNLLFEKGELSQKRLCRLSGQPKSTMSRIIKRLEERNFVSVKKYGNTRLISLTDWFLKK